MSSLPIVTRWNGEAFEPLGRSKKEADAQRIIGQIYRLVDDDQRSEKSHRFYFASILEGWANLPEDQAERFQNPEALRKHALIKTGYATQRQYVAASKAEAERVAAFCRSGEEYEIAAIKDNVVTFWRAESQSYKSMGKKRFEKSKADVLGFIASLIGVTTDDLQRSGEAA